ncbi:MAG: flagellar hook-associated protein FlgK [Planctomycetota bacterium]|jgi:flagellar hook-associated protein 1 FlgK|nr:flagellar hook-associated protein FlgK [Planctomycetota bacterium]
MAFHTLAIGTSALLTASYGLDVTGQNLGNIETPGYSRQRLNQEALTGWTAGLNNSIIGTGVWTQSVKRIGNEYIEKQLRQATSSDAYYTDLQRCYSNLQSFFSELSGLNRESGGTALSDAINNFWDGMSDFAANVENLSIRTTVATEAEQLASRFNSLGQQLAEYRKDVDNEIAESVVQINRLIEGITQLNKAIVNSELGGASDRVANDLRDQRGEAIKELYGYMDIDVVEEANGSFIVSIHGRNLVYYDQVTPIAMDKTPSDDGTMVNTPVFAGDRYPLRPSDGELAAQIEMRDVVIKSYKDDIDKLAANFIWEFNRAYSQTRGLESFSSLTSLNAPTNPAETLDKLVYKDLIPAGTFQIQNGNFEIIIHNRNTDEPTTVNIEIDLDGRPSSGGEPDTILWDPDNPDAENSLVNRMQRELDKVMPGVFEVSIDRQYRVSIESKSPDYGFCFGADTSGVLAALGLNAFFTGHNSTSMGVNPLLAEQPALLGGAKSFADGDNSGAMELMAVRDQAVAGLADMTLEVYYQSVAGRLASEANRVSNQKELSGDILTRMFTQRESLAGVNEDEEVAKMITYQRAFQSAAKFISTMDQLYETLINM